MEYSIESLVKSAKEKYIEGNFLDSISAANKASELDPEEVNAFWYAGLSHFALNNVSDAHDCISEVVNLAPHFANGWAKYAVILQSLYDDDLDDDAIDAFEKAVEINSEHIAALTSLATIRRKIDSSESSDRYKEISVLSKIDLIEGLSPNQLNRLGFLHYSTNNFFEAIKGWERNVSAPSGASLFNLGLAFNHSEVSQDADAIDIWRIALSRGVLTEKVEERISALLPRLLKLAKDSNETAATVLDEQQFYDNYLSPFELMNYQGEISLTDQFDFKKAQKYRKLLIQEIELEDGAIHWLDGAIVDKSRAISLCDELYDDSKRYFHALVYNDKNLLNFLSKGSHQHFCVDEHLSPIELIQILDDENSNFKSWLSGPFSIQFDRVLSIAVNKRFFFVLEVLLDGRRWVHSNYNEECFKSAKKALNMLLIELDTLEERSDSEKLSCVEIRRHLEYNGLLELLNLLPSFFWEQQNHAVKCIRQIAISAYNEHGDADLSKNIIELTSLFEFKSEELKQRISDDIQAIEDIIRKKKEDEVHLVVGLNKTPFTITEDGVTHGNKFISTDNLTSLRWGGLLTRTSNNVTNNSLYVFNSSNGEKISILNTFSESSEIAKAMDGRISDAIFAYLFSSVLQKLKDKIGKGYSINIGNLTLNSYGVSFESGWFVFSSVKQISWANYKAEANNGQVVVFDQRDVNIQTSLSIREINNSVMLLFIGKERD
jgi:tetratricopeptide (TPR) repeat protein